MLLLKCIGSKHRIYWNPIVIVRIFLHSFLPSLFSQGYVLQFGLWGENVGSRWNGGVATIEEYPDEDVWGVVWKMATEDITSLDKYDKLFFQPAPFYTVLYRSCI